MGNTITGTNVDWAMVLKIEDNEFDQIVKAVAREIEKKLQRNPFDPEFYTPQQVAKLIGCSSSNVRKNCLRGLIQYVKNGKSICIPKAVVDRRIKNMKLNNETFWHV